ncbi:MAG: tetratricopeptide repeat protein, partial [Chloroflexi bacterium]|nr:tetratricopeptide repeat protein [Chloroflexota bacterium]
NDLGDAYSSQERHAEAEQCYQKALEIREKSLGREHPGIVVVLRNYASLLHMIHREEEAVPLEERARAILGARA